MDLRITSQSLVQQTIASVRRRFSNLAKLQQQATTGKKLLLPSDDPAGNTVLLASRAQQSRLDADLGNIRDARALLDVSVPAVSDAGST